MQLRDLTHHLCAAADECAQVVVDAIAQQKASDSANGTDLTTTMTAVGRVVAAILAGLQKLVRLDSSDSLKGQVTYALVRMYETILAQFDPVSQEKTLEESAGPTTDPKTSTSTAKAKPKGGPPRVNIKDIPTLNALASLLSGIIKQLGLLKPIYKQTARHGHFGRNPGADGSFSWERVDKAKALARAAGTKVRGEK